MWEIFDLTALQLLLWVLYISINTSWNRIGVGINAIYVWRMIFLWNLLFGQLSKCTCYKVSATCLTRSLQSTSAPCSRRHFTIPRCPSHAATCSGVRSTLVLNSCDIPALSRSLHTSRRLYWAAKCNGLVPSYNWCIKEFRYGKPMEKLKSHPVCSKRNGLF